MFIQPIYNILLLPDVTYYFKKDFFAGRSDDLKSDTDILFALLKNDTENGMLKPDDIYPVGLSAKIENISDEDVVQIRTVDRVKITDPVIEDGEILASFSVLPSVEDMPEEDRIKAFVEAHKPGIAVSNQDLFGWHHRLTGSCLMGRNEFVERHGVDLNASTTPEEFIRLTEHAYGGDVIRKLRSFYDMD